MRLAVFLMLVVAILANGVSNLLLQMGRPDLAVQINPLNTEARITWLNEVLSRNSGKLSKERLKALQREAQTIIRLLPADGRGYSLLGAVRFEQGKREEALELFQRALKETPTEHNALLHLIDQAAREGKVRKAVELLNVLLRRWPGDFERVKKLLLALSAHPTGGEALASMLGERPPWRWLVVRYLAVHPSGRAFVQQLLMHEAAQGHTPTTSEMHVVLHQALKAGDVQGAYRTFVFTLPKERRKLLGFVFDATFMARPTGMPFDWSISRQAGVDIIVPVYAGKDRRQGLLINFQDVPVRLGNVYQQLVLLPGEYELSVLASARDLVAPKGLYWQVYCQKPRYRALARLALKEGTYTQRRFRLRFSVPPDCSLQMLRLATDLRTPTWSARYRGSVLMHEVRIMQVQAASAGMQAEER